MANSLISWKKGDYIKLGKAVSRFNQRIKELKADELSYLPEMRDYKDLRDNILSRKELNRVINSLNRLSASTLEKVELASGEELTKWEYHEIKLARNRAVRTLKSEAEKIKEGNLWVGMGDERLDQIESTIESIEEIENLKGKEFRKRVGRLSFLGKTDIELVRAEQFRENFLNAFEEMGSYDNYELLKNKLESIKNPIKFYEFVRENETLLDLFLYYKDKATAQTYGGFASNQDAFNYVVESLGLIK